MSDASDTPLPDESPKDPAQSDSPPMSAEDLGNAFARMLEDAGTESADSDAPSESSTFTAESDAPPSPRQILEALLFVGTADNEPLSTERLCQALRGVDPAELSELVEDLNRQYSLEARPYEIASQGGGYRMTLKQEYERLRDKFYGKVRQARLSQAAVEVLAIVAYNQPVTADAVAELRGTPSGLILSQLVRRQLLQIERSNTKPRKTTYFTTDRFLALFGLSHVSELPRPVEAQVGAPG